MKTHASRPDDVLQRSLFYHPFASPSQGAPLARILAYDARPRKTPLNSDSRTWSLLVSLPTQECRDVEIVGIALLGVIVSDTIAAVTDNRRAFKALIVNVIITAALDQ